MIQADRRFARLSLIVVALCLSAPALADVGRVDVYPASAVVPSKSDWAIVRSASGDVIPSQTEREGGSLRVTWLANEGDSYRIEYAHSRPSQSGGVRLVKGKQAIAVTIDGQAFTRYVYADTPKPYCYPIIGPTGKPVTRAYPMEDVTGETHDHKHHRSLWFTHGSVNGVDFWSEEPTAGKIVHRKFDKLVSGPLYGRMVAMDDWIAPDGKKVCEDTQDIVIYRVPTVRLLDFAITVKASEGPLKFGDTKEGSFGIRVADSMRVDGGGGHIINSRGERDAAAWGKQAEWCDYSGPVDGKTVGFTIMDHPESFRHPTYWHVRTYGLFGVNPFGVEDFTGDKTKNGSYTVPAGGSVTFRYRILIHEGDASQVDIPAAYEAYAHPITAQ